MSKTTRRGSHAHSAKSERARTHPQREEAELVLLAIEEAFIAEYRAGRQPRLSAYLQRYPAHATALTGFAAAFLSAPDEALSAANRGERPIPIPLSTGTQQALSILFGDSETRQPPLRKIAETPAPYNTTLPPDPDREGNNL